MTMPTNPSSYDPIRTSVGAASATDTTQAESVLTNISPYDPPPMKTLVYTPDIQILIARGNKEYDVSADIISWSVRRPENSVASLVFKLSNKDLRYQQKFERMDRVIVKLKRVNWVQSFSGYLDSVPHVQLYPGTVNFRASCTLKRLLHTWWDPGLPSAHRIFDQAGAHAQEIANGETIGDMGLGSVLRRLLVEVGGWSSQNIHIQRVPTGFYTFLDQQVKKYKNTDQNVEDFKHMLLGSDTTLGEGETAGRVTGVNRGGYVLTAPERMAEVIKAVDEMGMGPSAIDIAAAQGLSTATTGSGDKDDKPAWTATQTVGNNWRDAAMKNDAAVHCFMTIMVESNWIMYANAGVPESLNFPHEALSKDGSSVGLYQQQNFAEWGNVAQRMNARESTGMFLQHLNRYDWRNMDRGTACQAVQRSAFPAKYAEVEQLAMEAVRAIREGTGGAANGQSQGISGVITGAGVNSATNVMSNIPEVLTSSLTNVPTINGAATPAAVGSMVGMPKFNTAGAASCAQSCIGRPYVWGAVGPASFDCSGLMQFCYRSIGLEIGRDTYSQAQRNQLIPAVNLVPGDMIQPHPGHTTMYIGAGMVIHAPEPGDVVKVSPIAGWIDMNTAKCYHVPGTEYGGVPVAPFDPILAATGAGAAPGTVAAGLDGGTTQVSNEPIARNLFTYQFFPGVFSDKSSFLFGNQPGEEEKAFINDQPLIQTVVSFTKAGLRNFQSLPNGDFYAYYPDYFGLDGKSAVFDLEDIEMKNVQIDFNDDALTTHVYVSGSQLLTGGGEAIAGWLASKGVATVENEWLFQRMAAGAPHIPGEMYTSGKEIMKRFGVRPLTLSMPSVQTGAMEFLLAVQTFMTKWAEQYSTNIETTFLPEVFPGMRLNLKGHNLQVYVTEVTHSGDFESGFTTNMTIMAPSNPNIARMASNQNSVVQRESQDADNAARQTSQVMM